MWDKIKPEELTENVFHLINDDWMLVAAEDGGRTNAMTASWGGAGILWGRRWPSYLYGRSAIPKNL